MWSIGQWVQVTPDTEDIYDWYADLHFFIRCSLAAFKTVFNHPAPSGGVQCKQMKISDRSSQRQTFLTLNSHISITFATVFLGCSIHRYLYALLFVPGSHARFLRPTITGCCFWAARSRLAAALQTTCSSCCCHTRQQSDVSMVRIGTHMTSVSGIHHPRWLVEG